MYFLIFRIAWRYLRAPRREGFISVISWFSVIGIFLGVATLIIVMAVMNGFRHDLLQKITGIHGHIIVRGSPYAIKKDHSASELGSLPEVKFLVPFVEGQALLSVNQFSQGILLTGLSSDTIEDFEELSIAPEVIEDYKKGRGIILGSKLARSLGAFEGHMATIISPQTTSTAFGRIPRSKSYPVIGTFDVGMYQIDSNLALLPIDETSSFFQIPDAISGFRLFLHDPNLASSVSENIRNVLDDPSLNISTWKNNNAILTSALEIERNVMFIILTLIILVAAFNIISGQIMLVRDKNRGIAILRTMGLSQRHILLVFLLVGSWLGFVGTLFGSIGGMWLAYNLEDIRKAIQDYFGIRLFQEEIYFLSKLPSKPEIFDVVIISATAFILVFLASLYPAWRAMKLEPVEILREN